MLQERGVAGLAGWWVLCVLDLARGALLERSSEMDWKRWIITGLAILLLVPPFAFWLGGGPYRLGSDLGSAAASLRANGWAVWPPASRTVAVRVLTSVKPNGGWAVELRSSMVPSAPLWPRVTPVSRPVPLDGLFTLVGQLRLPWWVPATVAPLLALGLGIAVYRKSRLVATAIMALSGAFLVLALAARLLRVG